VSWEDIPKPRLDAPTPAELPLHAPTTAWPHTVGGVAGNGRAALWLGYARTTRWTCELPEGPPVVGLLAIGERSLAIRAPGDRLVQHVELIDGDGRHQRTITGRIGDWAIDVERSMLLGATEHSELAAWSLDDPSRPPILVLGRLDGRELDSVRLLDQTLVVVTHQVKQLRGPPPDVIVDVVHIPHYDDVSRWRSLRSQVLVAERIAEGLDRVVLGFDPAGPILAGPEQLWWGNWYLRERGRIDPGPGSSPLQLVPRQLAPRGDGSGWLLTGREDRTELWHVAVGRCHGAFVLDPALSDGALLIAPDDAAVIVSSSQVACFDESGALRWSFPRSGAATGLIDPNGVALYSDRGSLIAGDAQGARATVWTAPDGVDRLGPLAATATRMWVASGRRVFGLG